MTATEQTQLDRIEQMLRQLLGIRPQNKEMDEKAAVLASGGTKALKEFYKAESERRANNA
jgi:hypothetical protein